MQHVTPPNPELGQIRLAQRPSSKELLSHAVRDRNRVAHPEDVVDLVGGELGRAYDDGCPSSFGYCGGRWNALIGEAPRYHVMDSEDFGVRRWGQAHVETVHYVVTPVNRGSHRSAYRCRPVSEDPRREPHGSGQSRPGAADDEPFERQCGSQQSGARRASWSSYTC